MTFIKKQLHWIYFLIFYIFVLTIDHFLILPTYGSKVFIIRHSMYAFTLFVIFDLIVQTKSIFLPIKDTFSKFHHKIETISNIKLFSLLFAFSLVMKIFYLKFNFSSDYLGAKPFFDSVFYENNWFFDLDDSPIHTMIGVLSYHFFGPEKMEPIVFIQLLVGSISVVLSSYTFYLVLKDKLLALLIGVLLSCYVQTLNWEAVIRYDSISTMFHVLGIFGLFKFIENPNKKNVAIFSVCIFFALLGKETIIYMLPFFLFYLLIGNKFNKEHNLKKSLPIILIAIACSIGILKIRDQINLKHFGIVSNKKPIVLLWNLQMFQILKPDLQTKYPELRDELWEFHSSNFTEEDNQKNLIQWTQENIPRVHLASIEWFYKRDEEGKYITIPRYNPILEESIFTGFFPYVKNSFIRYFHTVNGASCVMAKESFNRIEEQMSLIYPLKKLNCNLIPYFSSGYWIFFLIMLFLVFNTSLTNKRKFMITALMFYPIIYGLFLSAATISEYHRLMLPVHYYMLPGLLIIPYLIINMRSNENSY